MILVLKSNLFVLKTSPEKDMLCWFLKKKTWFLHLLSTKFWKVYHLKISFLPWFINIPIILYKTIQPSIVSINIAWKFVSCITPINSNCMPPVTFNTNIWLTSFEVGKAMNLCNIWHNKLDMLTIGFNKVFFEGAPPVNG